jgi:hypothetical protein
LHELPAPRRHAVCNPSDAAAPAAQLPEEAAMASSRRETARRWSRDVTTHSDALDLEHDVFRKRDPKAIARSLKRSAEASSRRKGTPYQSAMSMLTFYVNRAGKNLSAERRRTLDRAKSELRKAFGRE